MARVMATVTNAVVTVARTTVEAAEVSSTVVYGPSRKPPALPQNKGAGGHGHQGMGPSTWCATDVCLFDLETQIPYTGNKNTDYILWFVSDMCSTFAT